MEEVIEVTVNGVRFVRACDQTQGCGGTVTISPPPKKTRGQEVAEKIIVVRGEGIEVFGPEDTVNHLVDTYYATIVGVRPFAAYLKRNIAAAIDAERKAERERCAKRLLDHGAGGAAAIVRNLDD